MNQSPQSIGKKISHVYLLSAAALLAFYSITFNLGMMQIENNNSKQRLSMVADFYFKQFDQGKTGAITIDPLVTIFDDYDLLPDKIKHSIEPDWTGAINLRFDDESEFNLVAKHMTVVQTQTVYALEDIDAVEIDDSSFAIVQVTYLVVGMVLFLTAAIFVIKRVQRISEPFERLAKHLSQEDTESFSPIKIKGDLSTELLKTLTAINSYRLRIREAIEREQSFTRYISHELRTPMTVVRGSISILRKQSNPALDKQITRIDRAINEMEQLTQIILLIARDDQSAPAILPINNSYIQQCIEPLIKRANANSIELNIQLAQDFTLLADPLLLQAVIQNLCLNAINCTINGQVSLFVAANRIDVIDSGVGLDAKPRGYEGFGIGLNLVRDICDKYHWQFELKNNVEQGCTATVLFIPH